jgi:hypothetical protein
LASAFIEIPDAKMVITAKATEFSARTRSSNRIFRYSGTDLALEP